MESLVFALHLKTFYYYYQCVDTPVRGLLVPEDSICPVIITSGLTWFIRYI